jgi:hypothetical protein
MINYRYDFDLYTLQQLPSNDARLFLDNASFVLEDHKSWS